MTTTDLVPYRGEAKHSTDLVHVQKPGAGPIGVQLMFLLFFAGGMATVVWVIASQLWPELH